MKFERRQLQTLILYPVPWTVEPVGTRTLVPWADYWVRREPTFRDQNSRQNRAIICSCAAFPILVHALLFLCVPNTLVLRGAPFRSQALSEVLYRIGSLSEVATSHLHSLMLHQIDTLRGVRSNSHSLTGTPSDRRYLRGAPFGHASADVLGIFHRT